MKQRIRVAVQDLGPELFAAALIIVLVLLVHYALEVDTANAVAALPRVY